MSKNNFTRDPRLENNPNKYAQEAHFGKKDTKGVLLRLSKYVLQHWPLFLAAIGLTLISNRLYRFPTHSKLHIVSN